MCRYNFFRIAVDKYEIARLMKVFAMFYGTYFISTLCSSFNQPFLK